MEEVTNGISNFFSTIFLWHSNATPINNATADQICVGAEVIFNIDNSNSGIGQNYPGSYFKINFGDDTTQEIFTHAELLINNGTSLSAYEITHNFENPSCEVGDGTTDEGTDGLDNTPTNSLVDEYLEQETRPPYAYPLRGVEVRIRVCEPKSRQARQVTVRHTFVPH